MEELFSPEDAKEESKGGSSQHLVRKGTRLEELKKIDEGLKGKRKPQTKKGLFGELGLVKGSGGGGSATRTFQPIKGFDLGSLLQEGQAENKEG